MTKTNKCKLFRNINIIIKNRQTKDKSNISKTKFQMKTENIKIKRQQIQNINKYYNSI